MEKEKILTMNIKQIVPWGNGLAIYLTRECKILNWKRKTKVITYTIEDKEGKGILIRAAPIKT